MYSLPCLKGGGLQYGGGGIVALCTTASHWTLGTARTPVLHYLSSHGMTHGKSVLRIQTLRSR